MSPAQQPAQQPEPPTVTGQPFMVQVSRPDPDRETLKDVIVGSFGLTGALVLGALVSGAALAGLWILWRRVMRRYRDDRLPTIGPVALSSKPPTPPPSTPDR